MAKKAQLVGLVLVAVLAGACGAAAPSNAGIGTSDSATLHFGPGRQTLTFWLREPAGVILLYRIRAPRGAIIRGSAQLPGITVRLWITTKTVGPSSPCALRGSRVTCTVGEEGCPMPVGTWRFRVEKLAGPSGDLTLWFRVGDPPGTA